MVAVKRNKSKTNTSLRLLAQNHTTLFNQILLTCWYGLDHQLCEVLLLELLEHRVGRAAAALGCSSSRPSACGTTASATSPPPATWPGRGSRSRRGGRNGSWKKLRRCHWGMKRNCRGRGCRGNVLGCCWGHRVSRSQARQERVRLRGEERLCIYIQYRRLKVLYYSIIKRIY